MSANFKILGMNIGANEKDYGFLHNQVHPRCESFYTLLKALADSCEIEDESEGITAKQTQLIEEIFEILSRGSPLQIDLKEKKLNSILIKCLYGIGWDIIEQHFDEPSFFQILDHWISKNDFDTEWELGKKIKKEEDYGALKFQETCPKFYHYLAGKFPKLLPAPSKNLEEHPSFNHFLNIKNRLAENFFRKVLSLPAQERPAVIALQEVLTGNKAIIDLFREAGHYHICYKNNSADCAIIIDTEKFENCHSYEDFYTPAIYAKEKTSGEEFIFISTCIAGYKLEFPENADDFFAHLDQVKETIESSSMPAIDALLWKAKKVLDEHPGAKIVIQGDFNSYPEYFNHRLLRPEDSPIVQKIKSLNFFEKLKSAGLSLIRTGHPTEYNSHAASLTKRELDFFYVSQGFASRLKIIHPTDPELSLITRSNNNEVEFSPHLLFSDHAPIYGEVTHELRGIAKIIALFKAFLAKLFPFLR